MFITTSSILQNNSTAIMTVILLSNNLFYFRDHFTIKIWYYVNKKLINKLILIFSNYG